MLLRGRQKITTEYTTQDLLGGLEQASVVLTNIWNTSYPQHVTNKMDIDYLIDYSKGNQPILTKEKEVRPEINNKLVVNHAQMITRNIIGYFLGNPIQYIQNGTDKKEEIEQLNRYVAYEDKASVDKEIGEYQSICGTAYRIIYADGVLEDEVPFEDKALNPSTTFVVYENSIREKPVVGITYHNVYDVDGSRNGLKIYFYTDIGLFVFITDATNPLNAEDVYSFEQYNVGGLPIIEYPNNMWRIGDWEMVIGLMDAINDLNSGRLDDIDQIVQSLLVFINAEIDEDRYKEMREYGVVSLRNMTNNPSSVDTITTPLDQSGMNLFSVEMESLLYALIGIPDRTIRGGTSGGDTGQAIELRDGWADLEIIARNKEIVYKKSEKQALKVILYMLSAKTQTSLSLMDVDIKFTRNKHNNLLVKTQGYVNLLNTKTLSPVDCLTIVDLVSDSAEFITRGEAFWGEKFAGNEPEPVVVQAAELGNNPDNIDPPVVDPNNINDNINNDSNQ